MDTETQALGQSSAASPRQFTGSWIGDGAAGSWNSTHMRCWHCRQWLYLLHHNAGLTDVSPTNSIFTLGEGQADQELFVIWEMKTQRHWRILHNQNLSSEGGILTSKGSNMNNWNWGPSSDLRPSSLGPTHSSLLGCCRDHSMRCGLLSRILKIKGKCSYLSLVLCICVFKIISLK